MSVSLCETLEVFWLKMGAGGSSFDEDSCLVFKVVNVDENGRKRFKAKIQFEDKKIKLVKVKKKLDWGHFRPLIFVFLSTVGSHTYDL